MVMRMDLSLTGEANAEVAANAVPSRGCPPPCGRTAAAGYKSLRGTGVGRMGRGGAMYLGIEIGGTKLQLGLGPGDGTLAGLWRGTVDVAAGAEGIQRQITTAVPALLERSGVARGQVQGVGIGFGGP